MQDTLYKEHDNDQVFTEQACVGVQRQESKNNVNDEG